MQKRLVLVCEDSLCPKKQPDVSGPSLGEAGRYTYPVRNPITYLNLQKVPVVFELQVDQSDRCNTRKITKLNHSLKINFETL